MRRRAVPDRAAAPARPARCRSDRPANERCEDPVLWRKRHKLVCLVAVLACFESIFPIGNAAGGERPSKTEEAVVSENVVVANEAKEKERRVSVINGPILILRQWQGHSDVSIEFASTGYSTLGPSGHLSNFNIPRRFIYGSKLKSDQNPHVRGWRLPYVSKGDHNPRLLARLKIFDISPFDIDISAKLPLGSLIRTSYEADSSGPQHEGDNRQQPLTRLDSKDFRSLIAAMFTLLFATWIYLRGWTVIGWTVAAYAIFGLLLRLDLWSLAVWIL